jgi:hypothetical protein
MWNERCAPATHCTLRDMSRIRTPTTAAWLCLLLSAGCAPEPEVPVDVGPSAARHGVLVPVSSYGIPSRGLAPEQRQAAAERCKKGESPGDLAGVAHVYIDPSGILVDGRPVAALKGGKIYSNDVASVGIAPVAAALREVRKRVDGFNDGTGCRVAMHLLISAHPTIPGSTIRRTLLTARKEGFLQADIEVVDTEPDKGRQPEPRGHRSMKVLVGSSAVDWFSRASGPGVGTFQDLEDVVTDMPPREVVVSLSSMATWTDLVQAVDAAHAGRPRCVVFDPKGERGLQVAMGTPPAPPEHMQRSISGDVSVLPMRLAPEDWRPGRGVVCRDALEEGFGTDLSVTFGRPSIVGPISGARFDAMVHSHRQRFAVCAKDETEPIEVALRVVVDEHGVVTSVVLREVSRPDEKVTDCLRDAMADVAFPPADAAVIATVPVTLQGGKE